MLNFISLEGQTQLHQKQFVIFEPAFCLGELFGVGGKMYPLKGVMACDQLCPVADLVIVELARGIGAVVEYRVNEFFAFAVC